MYFSPKPFGKHGLTIVIFCCRLVSGSIPAPPPPDPPPDPPPPPDG